VTNGGTPPADKKYWNGEIPFMTPPDLRLADGGEVITTQRTVTRLGVDTGSSTAAAGSVVVSIRAPIGYVGRTVEVTAFNQGCRAITPDARSDPRYTAYSLVAARDELDAQGRGTTFMEVSASQFMSVPVPLPPLAEQLAIADFLDQQTSRIDTLIAKQTQLMTTLLERRDAYLGQQFGAHGGERVTSVRRVLRPLLRLAPLGLGVITAYRDGEVTLRSSRREDGYTFSDKEAGYQEIRPGDLVFHALDGFAGACGVSDSNGVGSPVYHVCEPTQGDDTEYLALLLRYLGTSGFLATQAPNVRQRSVDFRNWSTFAQVPLTLPTPDEQRAFVQKYAARRRRVDSLIAKTQEHVALAQERRSALITAAVTGQITVRTAGRTAGAA